jgi:hypothetical protein
VGIRNADEGVVRSPLDLKPLVFGVALGLAACGSDPEAAAPQDDSFDNTAGTATTAPASDDTTAKPTNDNREPTADPNAPPTGSNAPSVTEGAGEDELIRTFAPHLNLHPEDANRPANVDWYLARVSMRFHHEHCPDHELLPTGKVTQAALVAQTHQSTNFLCGHDGPQLKSTADERFFLEVTDHETYKGSPRAEWKTYVVSRPRDGGLLDLEYWFFYPYNDGFSIFNHESDWEHVRVTVDPKGDGGKGKMVEVKLSQHHGGAIFKAGDAGLELVSGTHPVAYVAKGTHANYPKPGTFDIEGTAGVAKDNAKAAATPADIWNTEDALVAIGTRAAPRNNQVFVQYWGRWGELGDLPETDGIARHFP